MIKKLVPISVAVVVVLTALLAGSPAAAQDMTLNGVIFVESICRYDDGEWYPYNGIAIVPGTTGTYTFTYVSHGWDGGIISYLTQAPYDRTINADTQVYLGTLSTGTLTVDLVGGVQYILSTDNDQSFPSQDECESRTTTIEGPYTYIMTFVAPGEIAGVAGCDLSISLPANAAVGTFSDWADLYWMPGEKLYPGLAMEPGQSVWVLGQDETGMYKKVILSCQYLWVEAGVIGPNYDDVWNGAPLPTDVVE